MEELGFPVYHNPHYSLLSHRAQLTHLCAWPYPCGYLSLQPLLQSHLILCNNFIESHCLDLWYSDYPFSLFMVNWSVSNLYFIHSV